MPGPIRFSANSFGFWWRHKVTIRVIIILVTCFAFALFSCVKYCFILRSIVLHSFSIDAVLTLSSDDSLWRNGSMTSFKNQSENNLPIKVLISFGESVWKSIVMVQIWVLIISVQCEFFSIAVPNKLVVNMLTPDPPWYLPRSLSEKISMAQYKTAVSPVLYQWRCCGLALSHWCKNICI